MRLRDHPAVKQNRAQATRRAASKNSTRSHATIFQTVAPHEFLNQFLFMWKRMIVMLVFVVLFIAGIAFWKTMQIKAAIAMGAKMAPPPPAVTTTLAKSQTWEPVLSAIGSLKAINGVTVSTDLAGIVSQIAFESGVEVKKGAMLV